METGAPFLCGCGYHDVPFGADPYWAHNEFLERRLKEEQYWAEEGGWSFKLPKTSLYEVSGVGISKPQHEVGFQLFGEGADDV